MFRAFPSPPQIEQIPPMFSLQESSQFDTEHLVEIIRLDLNSAWFCIFVGHEDRDRHGWIEAPILVQVDLDLEVRERGVLAVGIERVCASKYLRLHSQIAHSQANVRQERLGRSYKNWPQYSSQRLFYVGRGTISHQYEIDVFGISAGRRKVPFVEYRAASHRDLRRQEFVFENRLNRATEQIVLLDHHVGCPRC